ncbi:hypothetical protein SARC_07816 [Sphaeroforma arctica JP610]|uniref:Uncharacterized protein n=1 Tax=Sphaeroforma arctica JP610 TaxID=667725 RepID=A0A0L0FSZ6_9EUKA|nr:hypothetical protein SARC_07816 [Sphaeroforma arctica JP610]KNC79804.1 hypothetical protein SARC_07816 [Sphaeroforma arctica JP610]|eukprot:XP_014153706.1 hypothetical protein SARC_07816 [Sphaeroforma arctica JP610]
MGRPLPDKTLDEMDVIAPYLKNTGTPNHSSIATIFSGIFRLNRPLNHTAAGAPPVSSAFAFLATLSPR